MGLSDGKIIVNIRGNVDEIILGLDFGTAMNSLDR